MPYLFSVSPPPPFCLHVPIYWHQQPAVVGLTWHSSAPCGSGMHTCELLTVSSQTNVLSVTILLNSRSFHAYLQHSRGRRSSEATIPYCIVQVAGLSPLAVDVFIRLARSGMNALRSLLVDTLIGAFLVILYPVTLVPATAGFFPHARRILSTLESDSSLAPPLTRQAVLLLLIGLSWHFRGDVLRLAPHTMQSWYLSSGLLQWEGAVFATAQTLLAALGPLETLTTKPSGEEAAPLLG